LTVEYMLGQLVFCLAPYIDPPLWFSVMRC